MCMYAELKDLTEHLRRRIGDHVDSGPQTLHPLAALLLGHPTGTATGAAACPYEWPTLMDGIPVKP